ncbi:uncharacterized protein LOC127841000 isoform X2 [Dreissena polymorpha]|uniref:uncharacterized protein LOC127841000 isoform X2 n=1 Tax=Dreissena polymorpha TaxID=45954 RepID=UPI0022642D45|nr:uncharacterized protein LOC127841000 isoform X2 [Dreissena polymorpha]
MRKSSGLCSFTSSWTCDHDPSFISSYTVCTENNQWKPQDCDTSNKLAGLTPLTFRQEPSQTHLEINCSCMPNLNFTIIGVEIISEARTFECYSSRDGYLKSCKGRELKGEERATSAGAATLYAACVKFDDPVSDVQIKFMGTLSQSEVKCYRLEFKVVQSLNSNVSKNSEGQVDMLKVRGFLHSMGDHVSPQALHLMQSVEQFQSTQMSSIGQLSSILGASNPTSSSQDGASVLSSLLSMVTARSLDMGPANQSRDSLGTDQSQSSTHPSPQTQSFKASPLAAMLQKVKDTQGEGHSSGDLDMYSMLQGICSKVSAMRVTQNQDSTTPEEQQNRADGDLEGDVDALNSEEKAESKKRDMTSNMEQTVSRIVSESEDRLKKYVDTRLAEFETRLCARFEAMLMSFTANIANKM